MSEIFKFFHYRVGGQKNLTPKMFLSDDTGSIPVCAAIQYEDGGAMVARRKPCNYLQ